MPRLPLLVIAPVALLLLGVLGGCQGGSAGLQLHAPTADHTGPLHDIVGRWHSTMELHDLKADKTMTITGTEVFQVAADGAVLISDWHPTEGPAAVGMWAWDPEAECYHAWYAEPASLTTGKVTRADNGDWHFVGETLKYETGQTQYYDSRFRVIDHNTFTYEGQLYEDTWRLNKVAEYAGKSQRK